MGKKWLSELRREWDLKVPLNVYEKELIEDMANYYNVAKAELIRRFVLNIDYENTPLPKDTPLKVSVTIERPCPNP